MREKLRSESEGCSQIRTSCGEGVGVEIAVVLDIDVAAVVHIYHGHYYRASKVP